MAGPAATDREPPVPTGLPAPGPQEAEASELSLVLDLQSGLEAAYETLVARYQDPVYSLVCRLVRDPGDACDIVQNVFVKVFRNITSFRRECSLRTWIYRIAVNEAQNHRRWFHRHRRQEVGLEGEEESQRNYHRTLRDPGASPYDVLLEAERHAMLEKALAQVKPVFRAAVILRDVEGMSYEEIGAVLKLRPGTVKSRIVRGREAIRQALAARLEPAPAFTWTPHAAGVELGSAES